MIDSALRKLLTLKSVFAVAAVMLPPESLVTFSVMVALPNAFASALVTGGTSLAGKSWAVNTIVESAPSGAGPVVALTCQTLEHNAAVRRMLRRERKR